MPPEARLAIGSSQLVGSWGSSAVTLSTEGTNPRGKDAGAAASIDPNARWRSFSEWESISSLTIAKTSSLVNTVLVLDSAISSKISALVIPVLSLLHLKAREQVKKTEMNNPHDDWLSSGKKHL